MKILFAALASAGLLVLGPINTAIAADLIAPSAAVPEANAYDWTGLYIGGNVGYTWTTSGAAFTTAPLDTFSIPQSESGFSGGLVLGYNQQVDNFVLGIEAGANINNIGATFDDPLAGGFAPPGSTVTAKSDYSGQLLVKGGVALGNVMPYLVGGVVAAHVTTTASAGGADDDGIFTGWGAGGGIAVGVDDHWSANVQYLHSDLTGPNFNAGLPYETSEHPTNDTVTAGINYKF